jgi:hypothetical protein
MMTDLLTKDKIRKLLKTKPFDVVGGGAHFTLFEDMGLYVVASFDTNTDRDHYGTHDESTYTMKIHNVSIEDAEETFSKTIPFDEEDLSNLSFNEKVEESIKENHLED